MKLGAEPKKVAILAGLLVVAAVVYFMNSGPSAEPGYTPPASAAASPSAPATIAETPSGPQSTTRPRGRTSTEFRPSVRPRRGEQRPDPMTIDPALRLDILAKLQGVEVQGSHRNIFDFGAAPPPKPDPVKVAEAKKPAPSPLVPDDPEKESEQAKAEPPKPQAPPIPLKFYGYVNPAGQPVRRAFFVEGEDIFVVREGEIVKKRYKIVRIGINSVVVEDTQFGSQQTLPLEEQQG